MIKLLERTKKTFIKPRNLSERIVFWSFVWIYPVYFSGGIYPVRVLMLWALLGIYLITKFMISSDWKSPQLRTLRNYLYHELSAPDNPQEIPILIWLWLVSMIFMGILTLVAMIDYDYKSKGSALFWVGTWGLIGMAPLMGYLLAIRAEILYRGACIVALQSLLLTPLSYAAYILKIPQTLYLSPLAYVFQNGPIYYFVSLYLRDVDTGGVRLMLFTPWAPALGLMGGLFLVLSLQEKQSFWRWIGVIGSVSMIVTSVSRGMLASLPIIFLLIWILEQVTFPNLQILMGTSFFLLGTGYSSIFNQVAAILSDLKSTRESSSKVRDKLGELALEQWMESPIWGHGKTALGPPSVRGMPIGSHHTWIGLLFTQGFMGLIAFLLPTVATIGWLVLQMKQPSTRKISKVTLTLFLIILSGSFVDNIDILAYLYWPALLMIGITLRVDAD